MGKKKIVTIADAAHLGGKATFKKHGPEHYRKMRAVRTANERRAKKSAKNK